MPKTNNAPNNYKTSKVSLVRRSYTSTRSDGAAFVPYLFDPVMLPGAQPLPLCASLLQPTELFETAVDVGHILRSRRKINVVRILLVYENYFL